MIRALLFSCILSLGAAHAANNLPGSVTRVVDVGAGLCTVTAVPTGQQGSVDDSLFIMVYDTGTDATCAESIRKHFSPDISEVDLLVISHSDYDHYGGAAAVMEQYDVFEIWHTGYARDLPSYNEFISAMDVERRNGAVIRSMGNQPIVPGEKRTLAPGVVLRGIFGVDRWVATKIESQAEARNATSIVLQLSVGDDSLLFTGDTVGRRLTDRDAACKDAEKLMVRNAKSVPLTSTVIIAPHHGSNTSSSTCFIKAVSPKYVVFPAGHDHHHPSFDAYERYLKAGVFPDRIFRTDKGDREPPRSGRSYEWVESLPGCEDQPGDDDVMIYLYQDTKPLVGYFDDGGYESCVPPSAP